MNNQVNLVLNNKRTGRYEYHHKNALGSTIIEPDHQTTVLTRYEYDVFGAVSSQTGTSDNARKFTGKEYDADVKLYYYGITIGFNEPVIVEKASIDIKPVGGGLLGWVAKWDDNSSVTITPLKGQGLVNGTEYVVEIKNVEDAAGQVLNTQITFTTTE